jgi:Alpha amylase, catalytic domain/Sucrose hydrolase-like, C-terminal domain
MLRLNMYGVGNGTSLTKSGWQEYLPWRNLENIMTATGGRSLNRIIGVLLCVVLLVSHAALAENRVPKSTAATGNWWESAAATIPVFIRDRPGKDAVFPLVPAAAASKRLDEMRAAGISAIEVYAPAEGGNSFLGLDTINRYRVEPKVGSIEDFRELVRLVHAKGMKIINIDNLGYSSVEAVNFLKACDDVKAGKDTREARFYLWSDTPDGPAPGSSTQDRYFMVRPAHLARYESKKHEFWQYSERADKYYWTKWGGVDLAGKAVRLPQYNWGSREFHEEVEKMVRFWMDTGIDGMMIDAVNWYVGCDWRLNRKYMTSVIASYGSKYSQPEGAGGFHEDPVPWITEGGWTCVQDYGLGIFWVKGSNVVTQAIESGDPRPIERALRDYHDRVVEVGGTLYFNPPKFDDPRKSHLSMALVAAVGDLISLSGVIDGKWSPIFPDAEETRILKWKAKHPAMHNLSRRQALPTGAADRHYAFLRIARDGSERLIAVMNFQAEAQTVEVDLSGVDFDGMADLENGTRIDPQKQWRVQLPAYGYRFFRLTDRKVEPVRIPPKPVARK